MGDVVKVFGELSDDNQYYEWWRGHIVGKLDRVYEHNGIEESVQMLAQLWKEEGPFDGIMGFSQGGAMATIIARGVMAQDPRLGSEGRPICRPHEATITCLQTYSCI